MMKQDQVAHTRLLSHGNRHLQRAVAKALFPLPVLLAGILRIVYEHIRTFHKGDETRIIVLSPLDIGGKDETPSSMFDAVNNRSIQGMTVGQPGDDSRLGLS